MPRKITDYCIKNGLSSLQNEDFSNKKELWNKIVAKDPEIFRIQEMTII
jgi:hypothetical protein